MSLMEEYRERINLRRRVRRARHRRLKRAMIVMSRVERNTVKRTFLSRYL